MLLFNIYTKFIIYNIVIGLLFANHVCFKMFLFRLILSSDIFNEMCAEVENIANMNRNEILSDIFNEKVAPRGMLLEYSNIEDRYAITKSIIYKLKATCLQKIAICFAPTQYNCNIYEIINILQGAIKYQNFDWNKNVFIDIDILIINDISHFNDENIDLILLSYFERNNFNISMIFCDDCAINNCELFLKRFVDDELYLQNFNTLYFYFLLKLDNPIRELLESFKTIDNIYLKNFEKYFCGFEVEIIKVQNVYLERVQSINCYRFLAEHTHDYPISFLFLKEESQPLNNLLYKKRIFYHDSLSEYKIDIKLYTENFEKISLNLHYNFDSLIVITFEWYGPFLNIFHTNNIFFTIKDDKNKKGNILKRTIKVYDKYHQLQSTYSYYCDSSEKFSQINFLPENIRETKRIIDMVKRIKICLKNSYTPFLTFKNIKNMVNKVWTENEIFENSFDYTTHFITVSISKYTDIAIRLDNLKVVFLSSNNNQVQNFLFNYNPNNNKKYEEESFIFLDALFNNMINNIAISENMMIQQKYGNSFGLRIVKNKYNIKQNYLIFMVPSFIHEFNSLNIINIIEIFRTKLKIKLGLLDNVLIAVNEKYKHAILNHFLMLEMIANFIYFVFLNEREKINLIKLVLGQIFQNPEFNNIYNIDVHNNTFQYDLQHQAFSIILVDFIIEIINDLLSDFFDKKTHTHFDIVLLKPANYLKKEYLEIKNALKKWIE